MLAISLRLQPVVAAAAAAPPPPPAAAASSETGDVVELQTNMCKSLFTSMVSFFAAGLEDGGCLLGLGAAVDEGATTSGIGGAPGM